MFHCHSGLFLLSHVTVIKPSVIPFLLSCDLFDLLNLSPLHGDPGCVHVAAVLLGSVLWARLLLCLPLCPAVFLLSLLLLCCLKLYIRSMCHHHQNNEYCNFPLIYAFIDQYNSPTLPLYSEKPVLIYGSYLLMKIGNSCILCS